MKKVLPDEIADLIKTVASFKRPDNSSPRFSPGDRIVVKNITPSGHTRLPKYARGRIGTVQLVRGTYVLPDTMAHGAGECPQYLYSVRFTAKELWGTFAGKDAVYLELWEHYIEGAHPHG